VQSNLILALGLIGQGAFSLRFILQWISSEKEKRSVVPISFWYMSVIGSLLLLIYACLRKDPVFILGQSCGFVIYIRNIYLIKHHPDNGKDAEGKASA
jgi:lipid-A-disaccharide synthase-like uncharacterized protein